MKKEKPVSKTMNVLLWAAQSILALSFIWAASLKLFQSPEKLAEMWPWTAENPLLVKATGVIDLLAGLGLVLPGVLKLNPKLTIFAAYGTILLMIFASVFHILRGEASSIGINCFFFGLAFFVAWGRSK